jgi:hypothetical protein
MRAIHWWLCASLLAVPACADRTDPAALADEGTVRPLVPDPHADRRAAQERLARRVALALRDPDFRAWVKGSLDGSRFREHKLPFARTLGAGGARGIHALAAADGATEAAVQADLQAAGRLEFYFPVPAHRAAWTGGEDLLVATEVEDHEVPVAYDLRGGRHLLSPDRPPATPVLAVVPQETDFDAPEATTADGGCTDPEGCDQNPPPPPPPSTAPAPGLYMTYFNAVKDFEGWLKGSPEFEVHILVPKAPGDTVNYKSVWCVGEQSPANVYWDSDKLTWSGNLLIYPQTQLSGFHQQYPGQDYSILVLEDDDEACRILIDRDLVGNFVKAISNFSRDYKATRDTTNGYSKYLKAGKSGFDLITAAADLIQTNDEIVGDAIANSVTGLSNPYAAWGLFGEGAQRNGWLGLVAR